MCEGFSCKVVRAESFNRIGLATKIREHRGTQT